MIWMLLVLTMAMVQANANEASGPVSSAELGDAGPLQPVSFGSGIVFRDQLNQFSMSMRFRVQNRADFISNSQSGRLDNEWYVRRARLRFNGHLADPQLRYLFQLSFTERDQDWDDTQMPNIVRDAMVLYSFSDGFQIGFGQGKLPGNRQRVNSSGDLQFVDRSLLNQGFNLDRDFGFQTRWQVGQFIFFGALTSGEGRNRSVESSSEALTTVGRIEWLPMGSFSRGGDYFESDLAFEDSAKISLGVTIAHMPDTARVNGTSGDILTSDGLLGSPIQRRTQDVQIVDFLAKYRGWSFAFEYANRDADQPIVNSRQSLLTGDGFNLQLGKMLTDQTELATRYTQVRPDSIVSSYHNNVIEHSFVFNYFLSGHRTKLQLEAGKQSIGNHFARLQVEFGI